MTITASDVKGMPSGEFASIADGTVEAYIGRAQARSNSGVWGDKYDTAVLYLTCHLLAVDMVGAMGAPGPVVSESAGSVSRTYAAYLGVTGSTTALQSTSYGRTYLQLLAELGSMGFVA